MKTHNNSFFTEQGNDQPDGLREIFSNFHPDMSGSADFIARLETRLSAIEDVKEQTRSYHRQLRRAVIVAMAFGFAAGIALTLSFPFLTAALSSLLSGITRQSTEFSATISWIAVGAGTLLASFLGYDFTMSAAFQKRQRP